MNINNHGRGHLYSCGGRWYVRFREQVVDTDGQVRTQQVSSPPLTSAGEEVSKSAIRDRADEFLEGLRRKSPTPLGTTQIIDFVEQVYFPFVDEHKSASTAAGYRQIWNAYIRSRVASIRLRDFRTCDGEFIMQQIAKVENLSHLTFAHIKSFLSGILTHAKRQGYLDGINPVQGVSIPRGKESSETYAYSVMEELQIIEAMPADVAQLSVALASFSGLSKAELRGLDWADYTGDLLSVQRNLWRTVVGKPKTRRRRGVVPVIPQLRKYLEMYRRPKGWVLSDQSGSPINLDYLTRSVIVPTVEATNLVWHGWHAFRRGLATNLYELGVKDIIVQAILRHSDVNVTRKSYIKPVQTGVIEAMNQLELQLKTTTAARMIHPERWN
jgi:integrase